MKMYLPFGDWSDDGHGKYDKLLIDAPDMSSLLEAQTKLKEKYGDKMFGRHFASFYEEPNVGEEVWQALQDTGWTPADVLNYDSYFEFDDLSLEEYREMEGEYLSICAIQSMFIWLLNAYGAGITCLDIGEDIPMICNWSCPGFETVGYGCYE